MRRSAAHADRVLDIESDGAGKAAACGTWAGNPPPASGTGKPIRMELPDIVTDLLSRNETRHLGTMSRGGMRASLPRPWRPACVRRLSGLNLRASVPIRGPNGCLAAWLASAGEVCGQVTEHIGLCGARGHRHATR